MQGLIWMRDVFFNKYQGLHRCMQREAASLFVVNLGDNVMAGLGVFWINRITVIDWLNCQGTTVWLSWLNRP